MSKCMEYSTTELSENALFVQILSEYPNMFQRPTTKSERDRQEHARTAVTRKFNKKCNTNLSIKQISRKINNMKARLKDKNSRSLHGTKCVKYHDWEKLFLKMWVGTGALKLKNKLEHLSLSENDLLDDYEGVKNEENLPTTINPAHTIHSNDIYEKSPISIFEPAEIEVKIDPDLNLFKTEDDIESSVSDISDTPNLRIETELTEQSVDMSQLNFDDGDPYEKMSFDELKRIVLISQTKMFRAQEAAARAKEKLDLYKLMVLKRRNAESYQH